MMYHIGYITSCLLEYSILIKYQNKCPHLFVMLSKLFIYSKVGLGLFCLLSDTRKQDHTLETVGRDHKPTWLICQSVTLPTMQPGTTWSMTWNSGMFVLPSRLLISHLTPISPCTTQDLSQKHKYTTVDQSTVFFTNIITDHIKSYAPTINNEPQPCFHHIHLHQRRV